MREEEYYKIVLTEVETKNMSHKGNHTRKYTNQCNQLKPSEKYVNCRQFCKEMLSNTSKEKQQQIWFPGIVTYAEKYARFKPLTKTLKAVNTDAAIKIFFKVIIHLNKDSLWKHNYNA